jgi:hypothetical protein
MRTAGIGPVVGLGQVLSIADCGRRHCRVRCFNFSVLRPGANRITARRVLRPGSPNKGWQEVGGDDTALAYARRENRPDADGTLFPRLLSFESPDYKELKDDLQKYHIGSLVVAAHTNRQGLVRASSLEAAKVANQLQADSKLPLLFAADLERGLASRLSNVPDFPWPMALGAAGDPTEA